MAYIIGQGGNKIGPFFMSKPEHGLSQVSLYLCGETRTVNNDKNLLYYSPG